MDVIYVLLAAVWLTWVPAVAPAVVAGPLQKYATPADELIHEAELLWQRGERKQAVEKIKQAVAIDAKPYALSRFVNEAIRAGNTDRFAVLVEAGATVGKDNDEFLLYLVSQSETPTAGMDNHVVAKSDCGADPEPQEWVSDFSYVVQ